MELYWQDDLMNSLVGSESESLPLKTNRAIIVRMCDKVPQLKSRARANVHFNTFCSLLFDNKAVKKLHQNNDLLCGGYPVFAVLRQPGEQTQSEYTDKQTR